MSLLSAIASHYVESAGGASWVDAVNAINPSAFYRLGEASGTTAADATGGAAGTYNGTPTLGVASLVPSDTADASIVLDGSGDYVSTPVGIGAGMSVMFTYKGTVGGAGFKTFFGNPNASSGDRLGLFNNSSGFVAIQYLGVTSAATAYATSNIADNAPHLIAVTFESDLQKLYVDGALVGSTTVSGNPATTTGYRIGQFSSQHYVLGGYDEFAVFPSILTDTQASDLYDAWAGV